MGKGQSKVRRTLTVLLCIIFVVPCTRVAAQNGPAGNNTGSLSVALTNIANTALDGRVEVYDGNKRVATIPVSKGTGQGALPAGAHRAYVYAIEDGIPLMVTAMDINIAAGKTVPITYSVVEGAAGKRMLRDFDRDFDMAIDRAEIEAGTNPEDPASIPGREKMTFPSQPLNKKKQWLRGELHAQSKYGQGTESVGELVRRAEALNLDFLAIADPNTLEAAADPEFTSKSVVLIPALAWGDPKRGYALIYGPQTFPDSASTHTHAQAVARLTQAQGGIFAIAHPCFPETGWKLYVPYANATQVWCREWNRVPPASLETLPGDLKAKTRKNDLIHSIAAAVATRNLSANGQAALFWDYELVQGRKEAPIAGSMTGSPKVPMAQPVTYILADEKSVKGVIDGLRQGRTFVSSGLDGPQVAFDADAMRDGTVDVGMGGAVPIGVAVDLIAGVSNAKGKKLEILYNGLPIFSRRIDEESVVAKVPQKPEAYSVYRMRVVEPAEPGSPYGSVKVAAMSSPIYAEGIIVVPKGMKTNDLRIQVQDKNIAKSPYVTPVYATGAVGPDGKQRYHIQQAPDARPVIPLGNDPLPDPNRVNVRELHPTKQ